VSLNRRNTFVLGSYRQGGLPSRHVTAEHTMKIYLLMTLFGILFTAIHFTSTPKQGSKQVSQQ
jgi:hypothetical protein